MRRANRPATRRAIVALSLFLTAFGGCAGTTTIPGDAPRPAGGTTATRSAGRPSAPHDRWPRDPSQPGAARADCTLPGGPVAPGGSFTIALVDSVRPHLAPVPRNRAERLVFAQLYETLVRVDCNGAAAPGLASQWT